MTDHDLSEKLAADFGVCPRCGSEDLNAEDYDGGRVLSVNVACEACGATWAEHYRFSSASDYKEGRQ